MRMTWLIFALMTVASWGLYGVLLHTGQISMSDPVHGRYKAFLFVGIAYLLTAVIGSAIMLAVNGAQWTFPTVKGLVWSTLAGLVWCEWARSVSSWHLEQKAPRLCDVHRFRRRADRQRGGGNSTASTCGRLERCTVAVCSWYCVGSDRWLSGDAF